MSRLHTGGHGKSKSRKPNVAASGSPEWAKLSKEEIEKIILDLAKQKVPQTRIGQMLKEKYGVLYIKQLFGKRLGKILEEQGVASPLPQDMLDLIKKAVNMREHLSTHHSDKHNMIRLQRTESKIWRLTKYYKSRGILPSDWKYEPEKAALLIKS